MKTEVRVRGSELGILLAHETPELRPGVLQGLDDSDRQLIKKLVDAPNTLRTFDEWASYVSGADSDGLITIRGLRERFNLAARRSNSDLRLHAEEGSLPATASTALWFSLAGRRVEQPDTPVAGDAPSPKTPHVGRLPVHGSRPRKRFANVFVSYARADSCWAVPLLDELKSLCRNNELYEVLFWRDQEAIGFGSFWHQIDDAIARCDLGLLLLSPEFLASKFIRDFELPHFNYHGRGNRKPCAVIECALVDREEVKQREIDASQILTPKIDGEELSYVNIGTIHQRQFVELVAEKLFAQFETLPLQPLESVDGRLQELESILSALPADETPHLQRNEAAMASWSDFESSDASQWIHARFDVIDRIARWATDPLALPFCALMGQYGLGKTTALKSLSRELFSQRAQGKAVPVPIYIDLRLGSKSGSVVPTLHTLLADHIERHENMIRNDVTADELLNLVRNHGALMIFDGFDEKAVHFTPGETQRFASELWKVLPDPTGQTADVFGGKLLISCRSHFFRDLREQARLFLSASRGSPARPGDDKTSEDIGPSAKKQQGAKEFLLLVMLPFGKSQIISYFTSALGSFAKARSAMEMISSIHNLSELSERPVLLPILARCLPALEQAAARNEVVNAAALYDYMIEEWLGRDVEKHKISRRHKRLIMEELAAKLHGESRQELSAHQLDEWLERLIQDRKELTHAYGSNLAEMLESDLRTATFIIRSENSIDSGLFRFAHTSLGEYFFACHLTRSLVEQRPSAWQVQQPSIETLEFVVQLLVRQLPHELELARGTWSSLLACEGKGAIIAFRCWLLARNEGAPEPDPLRVMLDGADLSGVDIICGPKAPWILRKASFRGAWLVRTHWRRVQLEAADFTGAQLSDAVFDECVLDRANFANAVLDGVHIRFGSIRECGLPSINGGEESRFAARSNDDGRRAISKDQVRSLAVAEIVRPALRRSETIFCTASVDGTLFAAGYKGGVVALWEASTGHCLHLIHDWNEQGSLAFSADGHSLLVPLRGGSMGIWNALSGRRVRRVESDAGEIVKCAFSPDGRRFVAVSEQCIVQIYDIYDRNRPCIVVHRQASRSYHIGGCGFAPDGNILAFAFADDVFCYDISELLPRKISRLPGHASYGIAFSPDGISLASVLDDRSVRFWDIATTRERRVIRLGGSADKVFLSADAKLAAFCSGRCVTVFDLETSEKVSVLWDAGNLLSVHFLKAGGVLINAQDGTLEVREFSSGRCVRQLSGQRASGFVDRVSLKDGRVVAAYDKRKLWRWNVSTGLAQEPAVDVGEGSTVLDIAPDQENVVAWDELGKAVVVVNAASSSRVQSIATDQASAITFSKDAQTIFVVSGDSDAAVYGVASGKELRRIAKGLRQLSLSARLPATLQAVGISSNRDFIRWDLVDGECRVVPLRWSWGVNSYAVSDDGCFVAVGFASGALLRCSIADGERLEEMEGHESQVTCCSFAFDGRAIVSGSADGSLCVWDRASDRRLFELKGHQGAITSLCVDGLKLATAALDGTVRLWDLNTRLCLRIWHLLPDDQYAVFDPAQLAPLAASKDAWRYFDTRLTAADGSVKILPAEALTGRWAGSD